jgi:hypothetical protein
MVSKPNQRKAKRSDANQTKAAERTCFINLSVLPAFLFLVLAHFSFSSSSLLSPLLLLSFVFVFISSAF